MSPRKTPSSIKKSGYDVDSGALNDEIVPVQHEARSSVPLAIFNITKVLIGAGILTAPEAMLLSGYFGSIILIFSSTIVMFITSKIVLNAGYKYGVHTYRGICSNVLGKWGASAESIITIILTIGSMISYAVLIADSLPPFLIRISGWKPSQLESSEFNDFSGISVARFFLDRRILLLLSTIFVLYPLLSLPNVHFLSYSSIAGLFCFSFIFIALSQRALTLPEERRGSKSLSEALNFIVPSGIASAISRTSFMNISHHMNFLIVDTLEKKTTKNINTVIISGLSISTICIIVFSSIMYFPINDRISGNIFSSFSPQDMLINICRLALSFHIMASFCLNGYACRDSIFRLFMGDNSILTVPRRVIFATIATVIPVAVAMFACDLGLIVDLTGSVGAGTLAFIFPGFIWLFVARRENIKSKTKHILAYLLLLYGFALVLYTVGDKIYGAVKSPSQNSERPENVCRYMFLGNVK